MKITLDLTDLVSRGQLTPAEAERLKGLASQNAGTLGINIILAFGVIAVAAGAGVLVPSAYTAIILGAVLLAGGHALILARSEGWGLLAQVCATAGALLVGGGMLYLYQDSREALAAVTIGVALAAIATRSGLLAAVTMLGIAALLGSETGYLHALYMIAVPEPGLNVGVFSLLALALYVASLRLPPAYERLAIIAARTSVLLVNVAFLVGSLWGDQRLQIPPMGFVIAWAVVLAAVGAWGVMVNRPWVVNAAATFGAIHFYTQFFERLGANPLTLLLGGILLVAFGMALWSFNRRRRPPASVAPAAAAAPATS
jgi:hypothetical protein